MEAYIFILALLFTPTNIEPIAVVQYATQDECLTQMEDTFAEFQDNYDVLVEALDDAGADDLMVGCFTPEEAQALLTD